VLRCTGPLLALHDKQHCLEFPVAIVGAADMEGRPAQPSTGANDPKRALVGSKYCTAAVCCRVENC
jgi:hypothetical protein